MHKALNGYSCIQQINCQVLIFHSKSLTISTNYVTKHISYDVCPRLTNQLYLSPPYVRPSQRQPSNATVQILTLVGALKKQTYFKEEVIVVVVSMITNLDRVAIHQKVSLFQNFRLINNIHTLQSDKTYFKEKVILMIHTRFKVDST